MTDKTLLATGNYPLTLRFDGACPFCNLEIDNLNARKTTCRVPSHADRRSRQSGDKQGQRLPQRQM